jgi:hypothetical protein
MNADVGWRASKQVYERVKIVMDHFKNADVDRVDTDEN